MTNDLFWRDKSHQIKAVYVKPITFRNLVESALQTDCAPRIERTIKNRGWKVLKERKRHSLVNQTCALGLEGLVHHTELLVFKDYWPCPWLRPSRACTQWCSISISHFSFPATLILSCSPPSSSAIRQSLSLPLHLYADINCFCDRSKEAL